MTNNFITIELQGAIRLAIRGAAHELTEYHNVPQPEADIITLTAAMCAVDSMTDLPALTFSEMILAIRTAVENEHADALLAERLEKEGYSHDSRTDQGQTSLLDKD